MIRWITFLFHNWRAKLGALALATVLWLMIRYGIGHSPAPTHTPVAPPAEAAPRE